MIDYIPLKIVRSWIFVLSIRTERTNISRRIMDKSMSYHLVLPFEALATFTSRATFHTAVMWSV